jgi:hypothetical protein
MKKLPPKSKRLDDALLRYVGADRFPLAILMMKPGEALPADVRKPAKASRSNGSSANLSVSLGAMDGESRSARVT